MFREIVDSRRARILLDRSSADGPVIYWMSRDQRADDNWALLYAQEAALKARRPVVVVFCLVRNFLGAMCRQYAFMLRGIEETAQKLSSCNIPFQLLEGDPAEQIPIFTRRLRASLLVSDFDPLRIKRQWKETVISRISIPFHEVDAHNIVPCWVASGHQEYGAYTLRPRIKKLLPSFLTDFPPLRKHPFLFKKTDTTPFSYEGSMRHRYSADTAPDAVGSKPGSSQAKSVLRDFIRRGLPRYAVARNDPNKNAQSQLSAYMHFGQISPQRVALSVKRSSASALNKAAFLEESIIRRELSDNFCFYNPAYDSAAGFPRWAQETLRVHRRDKRPYSYSLKIFEQAKTHDPLWNAAQIQLAREGKMHGYLRMYWAKKILEWTPTVAGALKTAIYLNDTYGLDGRDPNGYAGIAWSIGGVHDRAWNQRPVFGKIRYMSYNGCVSKFDVGAFVRRYSE